MYRTRLQETRLVDLVLDYAGRLFPIEVKLNSHPTRVASWRFVVPTRRQAAASALILAPVASAYPLGDGITVCPWDAAPAADKG